MDAVLPVEGSRPREQVPPKLSSRRMRFQNITTTTGTCATNALSGNNPDRHDCATANEANAPRHVWGVAACGAHRVHSGLGSVRSDRYSIDCVTAVSMPDMRMTLNVLTVRRVAGSIQNVWRVVMFICG